MQGRVGLPMAVLLRWVEWGRGMVRLQAEAAWAHLPLAISGRGSWRLWSAC